MNTGHAGIKKQNSWCGVLRSWDPEFDTVSRVIARQWHGRHFARNNSGPWTRTGTPTMVAGTLTPTRSTMRTGGTLATRWFLETLKFSPRPYGREFLFRIPFLQPPNSRPIPSSFSKNSVYSLVVISLFSHKISEKNLILSIFNIDCSRNGTLFAREAYLLRWISSRTSRNKLSIFSPIPNRSGLDIFLYNTNQYV